VRVALVHRRFTTHGGTERWLVGFARWLVAHGHAPTVLCAEVRDDLLAEPGVRFVRLPTWRPARMASLWWSARRALETRSWDAVMGFGRTPGHDLFRAGGGSHAEALRRLRPWGRLVRPADLLERALDRHAVRGARVVIANSRLGAEGLVRDYGAPRVEVVYNGVDRALFRPDPSVRRAVRQALGVAWDAPVALFLGTGFRRKGLDRAIAAVPPHVQLWVAGGDRPWRVPPHVRHVGAVRAPERLLQAADVLVLPTRYDPFANACLEALACGIPFVTTSANGAAEIAPHGWMVADDLAGWRAGLATALEGRWHDDCVAVAERHRPADGYARAMALLREASGA
jgi:UDP-glucose:(heptosyl)LPS alpha-1,3-glucosyltransferase